MKNPTIAVLLIGNELLSGRTADANLNYIARRLTDEGLRLMEARVVRDDPAAIVAALKALSKAYDFVFTTGGIGPTHDDITVSCVAQAFGVGISRNSKVEAALQQALGSRATPATFKMADYPDGARLIPNGATPASGFMLENVIVMAGIPRIMQAMFEAALPLLPKGAQTFSLSLDTTLIESQISLKFEDIQRLYPQVELGSYPFTQEDRRGTSLVVRGTDRAQVDAAFEAVQTMVADLGGLSATA